MGTFRSTELLERRGLSIERSEILLGRSRESVGQARHFRASDLRMTLATVQDLVVLVVPRDEPCAPANGVAMSIIDAANNAG